MTYTTRATSAAIGFAMTLTALPAAAQDRAQQAAIKARQGQFNVMMINLGILGDMARGNTEYDAEAAQTAADTLVAVSMINQTTLWLEGTDTMSVDGVRAEPAIWDNLPDFLDKWGAYADAAAAMQAVASDGRGALGPALGQMGGTCQACHDDYRTSQ